MPSGLGRSVKRHAVTTSGNLSQYQPLSDRDVNQMSFSRRDSPPPPRSKMAAMPPSAWEVGDYRHRATQRQRVSRGVSLSAKRKEGRQGAVVIVGRAPAPLAHPKPAETKNLRTVRDCGAVRHRTTSGLTVKLYILGRWSGRSRGTRRGIVVDTGGCRMVAQLRPRSHGKGKQC